MLKKEGINMVVPENYVLAKTDDFTAFQNFENWLKAANFTYHAVEPKIMNIKGKNKVVYSVYIMYSDAESLSALKDLANNKTGFFCCSKIKLERKFIVALAHTVQEPNGLIRMDIHPNYVFGLFDSFEEAEEVYEQFCPQHHGTMNLVLFQVTGDNTNGDDEENLIIIEQKGLKIHISDEVRNSGKLPFEVPDTFYMPLK